MSAKRIEITVGLFVLVGAACLVYIALVLGQVGGFGTDTYQVFAIFDSVEGLTTGASVEVAGVPVGRVNDIQLTNEGLARVELQLKNKIRLDNETICSVRTKGIIGEKFLRLALGGGEKTIPPGGKITETEPALDLQDVISQFIHGKI